MFQIRNYGGLGTASESFVRCCDCRRTFLGLLRDVSLMMGIANDGFVAVLAGGYDWRAEYIFQRVWGQHPIAR